ELGLEDTTANDINKGLATIKRQLEADNYTVKGLQLTPLEGAPSQGDTVASVQVPKDASIVVVAGAKRRLPRHAVDAIRNYMEPAAKDAPKGKLIVFFDQTLTPEKDKYVETGLEDLLGQYNVQIGQDRVLQYSRTPLLVEAMVNDNPGFMRNN